MIVRLTIFMVALACSSNIMFAQETPSPSPVPVAIPTGITDPAAATRAWLDTIPPDEKARSDAYFEGGYWLILWNFLLTAAVALFLLASGFSARLRDFSERVAKIKNFQIACYAILYLLFVFALSFPLNLYENFFREHQYGLATQS